MSKLTEGLEGNLQEIVLTRWGHAMAVPSVGFFKKMTTLTSTANGAFALAHCSTQGLACAESAVRAARLATKRALASKTGSTGKPDGISGYKYGKNGYETGSVVKPDGINGILHDEIMLPK
jgi:hypothetical protein